MIGSSLNQALRDNQDRPFLVAPSVTWSYAQAAARVRALAGALERSAAQNLACYLPDSPDTVILILAAAVSGKSLLLINRDFSAQQLGDVVAAQAVDLLIVEGEPAFAVPCPQLPLASLTAGSGDVGADRTEFAPLDSELLLLTSGTTDTPKCVSYQWSDLLQQVGRHTPGNDERWLLAYKLNHFAGVQMLAHILANGSTLVLAASGAVADSIAAMSALAVTHVSSTPTFWRFALAQLSRAPHLPALRQVTLGSEPVSGELLARLAGLFPQARIVHIYALTEAGSCVSVSDGQAGIPCSVLERPPGAPVRLRIRDGQLEVLTRHGMRGYRGGATGAYTEDGWFATGDLVKIEGDRILFVGRQSETINVGGVKVHPLEVEHLISALDGVQLVRVFGQANPVVGQIVAVDLVIDAGCAAEAVEDSVREACLALPPHSRPRIINIVESLATNNYKLARTGEASR